MMKKGRAPQGARGLKSRLLRCIPTRHALSRPARGAWIEIRKRSTTTATSGSRAPQGAHGLKGMACMAAGCYPLPRPARGAWIEITVTVTTRDFGAGRAPQGARGLKYGGNPGRLLRAPQSRPARGAWIEMSAAYRPNLSCTPSRPARGAWIEILAVDRDYAAQGVAPRKGRVD